MLNYLKNTLLNISCGSVTPCGNRTSDMKHLSTEIDDLSSQVSQLSLTNNTIDTISDNHKNKVSYSDVVSAKIDKNISNIIHTSITNHTNYKMDLDKRSICHILHGVPDESDPSTFVNDLSKSTLHFIISQIQT